MQSLTASTPCKPRNGFAFHSSLSICESFVNYCNLLLQSTNMKTSIKIAILDSGVKRDHPDFLNNQIKGFSLSVKDDSIHKKMIVYIKMMILKII